MHNIPATQKPIHKIAVLGNYLPRQCGIATFTSDLVQALAAQDSRLQVDVLAMNDGHAYDYPARVVHQIEASDPDAYLSAADFLNDNSYDVLLVQHEYGIFGGGAGGHLLSLLREVNMPIVTTLHTVLREPDLLQRAVTAELLQLSEKVVVMSEKGVEFLESVYGANRSNIDLIPHGIPDFSQVGNPGLKAKLEIKGPMILTFGLLSPDKGIQFAIEAMPAICEKYPDAVYVVLGATHPNIRMGVGEGYRDSLVALTEKLGVKDNIRFVDSFVSQEDLIGYLAEADIYITPYLNPHQITSGTLAYALGAGKAVISTPYWYAEELLGDGRGVLVPFRDSAAIADGVLKLESAEGGLREMGLSAARFCSEMKWPRVAERYIGSLGRAIEESSTRLRVLVNRQITRPPAFKTALNSIDHLINMTDDTGLFQHAVYTIPNRSEGYCVDDNCRALLFTAYLESDAPLPANVEQMQRTYLSFVHDSFNASTGRFRNFMSYTREWLEDQGSEDSHGRVLWSLGTVAHRASQNDHRLLAKHLFQQGAAAMLGIRSPRSWAYTVLGCDEYLKSYPLARDVVALQAAMANRLFAEYRVCRTDDWRWFEDVVSYANARLCQALIVAGEALSDAEMLGAGLESLEWLMNKQMAGNGYFRPIGSNEVMKRNGSPAKFDQQPVEAWASISACISAANVSDDQIWMVRAENAFKWFMGRNDLEIPLCDTSTGGCRDGLHPDRVNENQGAESTLSFLCALTEMESVLQSSMVPNTSVRLL